MKCVFLAILLLQGVIAAKNITLSIDVPRENPADVSYVEGKAPDDLKAGPVKSSTTKPKEIVAQAAFIRSSNREIPKDDEIENEEFERFIQKYHSRPTIETVFVSTSPSPPAEDSEEFVEETNSTASQVEVFNRPSAQLRAFERSVAHPSLSSHILPPSHHQPPYAIIGHDPHDASLHGGGAASFSGSDGYVFQTSGGDAGNGAFVLQSNGDQGGQIILTGGGIGGGGDQQYYQYANFVPRTFNVAQNAIKTKTFEIRRPAIQRHYYDIEERVIVRPAGSIIVELDRPVAKVPTGETVVAIGGLTGTLTGNGFQQTSQGGISFANAFGINGAGGQGGLLGVGIQQSAAGDFGLSQGGGLSGSGITFASSVGAPSASGSIGGFQQSQGAIGVGGSGQGGIGIQQSQSGVAVSTTQSPNGSPSTTVVVGTQQQQGGVGGAGIQQSQSGITVTTTPAPGGTQTPPTPGFGGQNGGFTGIGVQQSQSGTSGTGFQQSQGTVTISTTPAPGGSPTSSTTNVFVGGSNGGQGGSTGFQQGSSFTGGFQQSQGGGVYSTTGAPFFGSSTPSPNGGGFSGIGFQQSQGALGTSQGSGITSTSGTTFFGSSTPSPNGGGFSGIGYQQSQSGIGISQGSAVTSTVGAPFFPSTTPSPIGGGFSGIGFQQSQGALGISQGSGVTSTSGTSFFPSTTSLPSGGGFSGIGFQQSQGALGISQGSGVTSTSGTSFFPSTTSLPNGGGFSGIGFQQSQAGLGISQGQGVTSTTGAPFFPSTTPSPNGGGFSGIGFQQSQGGISQNGGGIGAGFQQSQGGIFSTTPAPYLPPAPPTPTVLIGGSNRGFSGAGFQQSQGGIGLSQNGGFAGFQQSQGGIGVTQGGITGGGFQQSQGGIGLANGGEFIYSTTTSSPSYSIGGSRSIILRQPSGGGYPVVSTTTGGPIIISTLNQPGHNGNGFVIQTSSNVHNKGSVSTSTTTERSFSLNQGVSAYAKGSSANIQDVSKHITPYKIAVAEPDFSYPSHVEITSNGSPLAHLIQQPYIQDPSQHYPRMRYQGQLLTGEVRVDDGLDDHQQSHHQTKENPSYAADITEHSPQQQAYSNIPQSHQETHQYVGSSRQPVKVSQISSSSHQQPHQLYQHDFLRLASQPLVNAEQKAPHQSSSQQHLAQQQVHHDQHIYPQPSFHQYYVHEELPSHQSRSQQYHEMPMNPQHSPFINNKPQAHHNLVAQIRHQQQHAPKPMESSKLVHHHNIELQPTESTHSNQQQVTEALKEPIEVSEIHSSTHQQPTMYQQQVTPTVHTLEPYTSGSRLYKQRGTPLKYTQDPSINTAPSEHTVYFNNNLEHTTTHNQNIEIPPEPKVEKQSAKNVESTTAPSDAPPTTTTQRRIEETTTSQHLTYAAVLAQSKPGILYAPPNPVVTHHSRGHKPHFLRFSADGSSLFAPSGRQLHFVYSDSPRTIYPHQSHLQPIPTLPLPIEPAKLHISGTNNNKGYQIQAQLPIDPNTKSKPVPASEPEITRSPSQSHAKSHQTSARYEAISTSTSTPETESTTATETVTTSPRTLHKLRGPQKYRNEQTHGAITLRSGRTYGDHRVIASTPAPSDGGAASESVQTRRIVVNHPFQTIQEVVEREPFTNIHQVTVNAPAKQVLHLDGLQEGQQKSAAYRAPPPVLTALPYKVVAQLNHPQATLSFHRAGSH